MRSGLATKMRQKSPIIMNPAPAILCRSLMSAAPNDATKTKNPMTMMTKLISGGATKTVPATISKNPMSAHRARETISLLTLSNSIPVPLSRTKRSMLRQHCQKTHFSIIQYKCIIVNTYDYTDRYLRTARSEEITARITPETRRRSASSKKCCM